MIRFLVICHVAMSAALWAQGPNSVLSSPEPLRIEVLTGSVKHGERVYKESQKFSVPVGGRVEGMGPATQVRLRKDSQVLTVDLPVHSNIDPNALCEAQAAVDSAQTLRSAAWVAIILILSALTGFLALRFFKSAREETRRAREAAAAKKRKPMVLSPEIKAKMKGKYL